MTQHIELLTVLPFPGYPEWQFRLVDRLRNLDHVTSTVFGLGDDKGVVNSRQDLYGYWQKFDARVFASDAEAAGQRGYEELASDTSDGRTACQQVFRKLDTLADTVADDAYDVVLWLLPGFPPRQLLAKARLGVWSLASVKNDALGFWELVDGVPMVTCELFTSDSNPARHRLLGRAFAKTNHLSLTKTLRHIRAVDESLVVSKLNDIGLGVASNARLAPAEKRLTDKVGRPGAVRLVTSLSKLYGRYALNVVLRQFHRNQWQLAYRFGGERLSQDGLKRIAPDDAGDFWADPFIVRRDDRTMIFFEEWEGSKSKGRIVAMEIEPDGTTGPVQPVLECDYHLSYPFLFEHEGELYMIPESADAGRVEAFRCVEYPHRWEPHAVLLDDIRAYDATLVEYDDRWWMFTAVQHNGNSTCDELWLYHAPGPFEDWTPHPANPVSLDLRFARPAGAFFEQDGHLYRPAQDCSERYGYALSIQRVLQLDLECYTEEAVNQIMPDWADDIGGTHTINQADGLTVYDCYARRRQYRFQQAFSRSSRNNPMKAISRGSD
ncbi:MAG: glucosamine inositolphosphorylceramide transferase family protein [Woeseiaceae bacterium]